MTHKDIYTKFMIEYDKANVTSSYPSLTEYEIATVLDKAYNALIAQKVTGNNVRRASLESDLKSVEDLAPLIVQTSITLTAANNVAQNVYCGDLAPDHLYFIDCYLNKHCGGDDKEFGYTYNGTHKYGQTFGEEYIQYYIPFDDIVTATDKSNGAFTINVKGASDMDDNWKIYLAHKPSDGSYQKVQPTEITTSLPFTVDNNTVSFFKHLANPYIASGESIMLFLLHDYIQRTIDMQDPQIVFKSSSVCPMDDIANRNVPTKLVTHQMAQNFFITAYNMPWIKQPVCYIEGSDADSHKKLYVVVDSYDTPNVENAQIVYVKRPHPFVKDITTIESDGTIDYVTFFDWGSGDAPETYTFECNSTVAEELISLAVTFALENVESQRLNSKLNIRGLEA